VRISQRVEQRIRDGLKKYRRVVRQARDRDVNESDTVAIIADILADVCGFDKYSEVTREFAIRGQYCDLAALIDGKPVLLIEVKAVGIALADRHLRQALSYATQEGIEWVVLTNGHEWRTYRVLFRKPVGHELAFHINLVDEPKLDRLVEMFFLLSREGMTRSAIEDFHERQQLMSRYMLAAVLQTDPVLGIIRRELRRVGGKATPSEEEILQVLREQVIKREAIEGDEAKDAARRIRNASGKPLKAKPKKAARRATGAQGQAETEGAQDEG